MPIKVSCPCGFSGQVVDDYAGRQVRCVKCDGVVQVPNADGTVPAAKTADSRPELKSEAAREILWAISLILACLAWAGVVSGVIMSLALASTYFSVGSVGMLLVTAVCSAALAWPGEKIAVRAGYTGVATLCRRAYVLPFYGFLLLLILILLATWRR